MHKLGVGNYIKSDKLILHVLAKFCIFFIIQYGAKVISIDINDIICLSLNEMFMSCIKHVN